MIEIHHDQQWTTLKMNRNVFPVAKCIYSFSTFCFNNLHGQVTCDASGDNRTPSSATDLCHFFPVFRPIVINHHMKCTMNNYPTVCLLRECTSFEIAVFFKLSYVQHLVWICRWFQLNFNAFQTESNHFFSIQLVKFSSHGADKIVCCESIRDEVKMVTEEYVFIAKIKLS